MSRQTKIRVDTFNKNEKEEKTVAVGGGGNRGVTVNSIFFNHVILMHFARLLPIADFICLQLAFGCGECREWTDVLRMYYNTVDVEHTVFSHSHLLELYYSHDQIRSLKRWQKLLVLKNCDHIGCDLYFALLWDFSATSSSVGGSETLSNGSSSSFLDGDDELLELLLARHDLPLSVLGVFMPLPSERIWRSRGVNGRTDSPVYVNHNNQEISYVCALTGKRFLRQEAFVYFTDNFEHVDRLPPSLYPLFTRDQFFTFVSHPVPNKLKYAISNYSDYINYDCEYHDLAFYTVPYIVISVDTKLPFSTLMYYKHYRCRWNKEQGWYKYLAKSERIDYELLTTRYRDSLSRVELMCVSGNEHFWRYIKDGRILCPSNRFLFDWVSRDTLFKFAPPLKEKNLMHCFLEVVMEMMCHHTNDASGRLLIRDYNENRMHALARGFLPSDLSALFCCARYLEGRDLMSPAAERDFYRMFPNMVKTDFRYRFFAHLTEDPGRPNLVRGSGVIYTPIQITNITPDDMVSIDHNQARAYYTEETVATSLFERGEEWAYKLLFSDYRQAIKYSWLGSILEDRKVKMATIDEIRKNCLVSNDDFRSTLKKVLVGATFDCGIFIENEDDGGDQDSIPPAKQWLNVGFSDEADYRPLFDVGLLIKCDKGKHVRYADDVDDSMKLAFGANEDFASTCTRHIRFLPSALYLSLEPGVIGLVLKSLQDCWKYGRYRQKECEDLLEFLKCKTSNSFDEACVTVSRARKEALKKGKTNEDANDYAWKAYEEFVTRTSPHNRLRYPRSSTFYKPLQPPHHH